MKEIIEDYNRENFTATEWVLGAIASLLFTIICGIV